MQGFLDKEWNTKNIDLIHEKSEQEFNFVYELNEAVYKMENEIICNVEDGRGKYILSSFLTLHKTYQSAIVLLEIGLQDDALSLFRMIFERLIHIKCALTESGFKKLKLNSIQDQIKTIKKIKSHDKKYVQVPGEELDRMEQELKQCRKKLKENISSENGEALNKNGKFNLKELAEIVEMEDYYNYMYPVLCKKVHSSMSEMAGKFNYEGIEETLDHGIQSENNSEYLQSLSDMMIVAMECICDYFKLSKTNLEYLYTKECAIWKA